MQSYLAQTIAEACARSDLGRTTVYELIKTGQLRKRGRRTLILTDNLRRCLEALPQIKVNPEPTSKREGTS